MSKDSIKISRNVLIYKAMLKYS